MAYSMDLRVRVLADSDAGMPTKDVAQKYSVSSSWVRRLKQRRRETGEVGPRQGKPGPKPKLEDRREELEALIAQQPDATLEQLRERLSVAVGITTIWRTLQELGITLKKSDPRGGTRSP